MSRENAELVRRGLEHFMRTGGPDWTTIDRDVVVHDHDILDAGEYRGHEGFGRWLEDWGAAWAAYSIEPEEFVDAGDRTVAILRLKAVGQASGVEVERQDALVVELRDGKWLQLDYYNDKQQALESIGLAG